MAKKIKTLIKIALPAGAATPARARDDTEGSRPPRTRASRSL